MGELSTPSTRENRVMNPSTNRSSEPSPESVVASPIFLVGAPRSGTTWLHHLMLTDERTAGGQESHFFVSFAQALRDFDRKIAFKRPHGLGTYWTRDELIGELRGLWSRLMIPLVAADNNCRCLIEKTPDHALHLDVIQEILPEAKVIHLIRDSRGVAASMMAASKSDWGRDWAPGNPVVAAETWNRFVAAAENAEKTLGPEQFLRVHYEDLHKNTATQLERIFEFIGLALDSAGSTQLVSTYDRKRKQDPDATGYTARGALHGTAVREPDGFARTGLADGWRNELGRREASQIWKKTQSLMEKLGYDKTGRSAI